MESSPRILLLGPSSKDTDQIHLALERGGISHEVRSVLALDTLRLSLEEFHPDLVLADYDLPGINGLDALRIVRSWDPNLPFILVSRAPGDDLAVETLKQGATDYIHGQHSYELCPAVTRALREVSERRERLRAEQGWKESQDRFRQLAEAIREVFWMTDLTKRQMIYISPGYEAIWGRSCESLYASPMNWLEAIHPDDRERVKTAALNDQVSGNYHQEYRILRPDGSTRWIQDRAFPVKNDAGEVYRIAGIAEDISAHKQAEQRLATEHAVFRALAEATTLEEAAERVLRSICGCLGWEIGAFWVLGPDTRFLTCLKVWHEKTEQFDQFRLATFSASFTTEEGLPGRIWRLGCPVWIPDVLAELDFVFPRAQIATECGLHAAFGIPIRLGAEMMAVMEFFSREIRKPDETVMEMIGALGAQVGQFISRLRAEEALRRAETKYRTIFENADEGIFQTSPEGRFLSANPALAHMFGYASAEELMSSISQTAQQLWVNPQDRTEFRRRLETVGTVTGLEREGLRKDGERIWVSLDAHSVRDASGNLLYYEGSCRDITRARNAEAQLATLAHAVESTSELICITDVENRFTFANKAFLQAYGYVLEEIIGKTPEVLFSPNNPPGLLEEILTSTREFGWQGEVLDRRKDGTEFPVHLSTSLIRDRKGEVLGLMGVARDITEQKRAQEQISLLADAIQSTQEFISIADTSNRFMFVNRAFLEAYGYSQAEVLGRSPEFLYASRNPSGLCNSVFGDTLHGGWRGEIWNVRKDGSEFPISLSTSQIRDARGRTLGLIGVARDISERHLAAEALRVAEAKFRAIFENATEGIFQATTSGRLLNANPALARMFGYESPEDLISSLTDLDRTYVHPAQRAELRKLLDQQSEVKSFEAERRRKDGSHFWTSLNAHAVTGHDGAVQFLEGTVQDISKRKRAEAILRESERKLRLIAENTTDVIFAFDMDRRPLYANRAVEQVTGYTLAEIQQRGFINWIHPEDQRRMLQLWEDLYAGKGFSDVEFRMVTKSGQIKVCSSTWGPLFDESGCQIGVQGREQDITERKLLQQEVLDTAANERRRIGHELHDGLGQFLAGISFRAKALENNLAAASIPQEADAAELARLISKAISQTRSLARGLDPQELELGGLPAALQSLSTETNAFFGVQCFLRCTADLTLPAQSGLALYRIAQEAIHNAINHGDAHRIEIDLTRDESHLHLRIKDDGVGFDQERQSREGMGLRVMHYRARSIGGQLGVLSHPKQGTEISCLVPVSLCQQKPQGPLYPASLPAS
jgi:PAS domain S-box-containing protein